MRVLTPEGVALRLAPAGPGPRAMAFAIDLGILFLLAIAVVLLFSFEAGAGLQMLALFLVWWGYPVAFELGNRGRTPGKLLFGLQVVREDGLPVGWRDSVLRNLLLVADFLPFLYLAGLVSLFLDARFRRLGDLVAGTLVIYVEKPPEPGLRSGIGGERPAWPFEVEEQKTLIDLSERQSRLSTERTLELAEIARPLTGEDESEASRRRLVAWAEGLVE